MHLKVRPVDALITMLAQAGASIISFHLEASEHVDASSRDIWLEVDAGVKADKAERICSAGAETLVAGSAISDGYAFTRIPWCPNPLLKLPVPNALKAVPLSTTHPVPHCVPICAPCAA